MAPATIIFHCPHCQVRLNVPDSMAGVSGPCPSCRAAITAPAASEAAVPVETVPLPPGRSAPVPESPKIRPEPRQLPERGNSAPISARHSTGDDHFRPREVAYAAGRPARPSRILHSLVPASFIAMEPPW